MKREFNKEKHITTFEIINTFDELLKTDIKDIIYTEKEGFGVISYNHETFVTKHKTLIHRHPYYNLHNSVFESQIINRDNFHKSGFILYKRVTRVEYEDDVYSLGNFVEKVYLK